jgi:hypothetical protein
MGLGMMRGNEMEFEKQIESEMKPNNEYDVCARCGEGSGEVPISDSESSFWICEYCDSEMFDNSLESKGLKLRETNISITGLQKINNTSCVKVEK